MRRRLLHMLGMLSIVCALLAGPAYANSTGTTTVNPIDAIHYKADPILSIDRDALFQRQFFWEAVENENFETANEDGSLSEWQTDWFISHDWSDYGAVIANLEPGDAVTVNGETILILGREEWPSGSINWDIYDAIGWDKVVFQTCLGDSAIWISYGVPVHPTPEFLAAHQ